MIQCNYIAIDGHSKSFDLDEVIDFVGGSSQKRDGWSGLICFIPSEKVFIELRDSPQDARGNSHSEAEEVTTEYIEFGYQLNSEQITVFLNNPNKWEFIDYR
ncbi:MAG: hypothetical protein KBT55_03400 [Porticoccus sp.]|nr:hypothetical protein [Porticoccus sp.]